jgi:GNAT superfamily N-acetyltransferase
MNLKTFVPGFLKKENLGDLTVRTSDFNLVARRPGLLKKLRRLTLHSGSGMNHELDNLLHIIQQRPVEAKAILAYQNSTLVGWAILSREDSGFYFPNTDEPFSASQGALFEVYVDPKYRRKGIGTKLIETAKKKCGTHTLCLCPWDSSSRNFFKNFKKYNPREL